LSVAGSIAVAGGGIVGLSTAWRLAQRGFRVTVFDQGAMGTEASWAGAGMLAPGGEIDSPSPLATMAIQARHLYPAFVRELVQSSGLAIDFQELGAIDLAYSLEEWASLEARAAAQAALGIQSKLVNPANVALFWPRVRGEGLVGARFYPGDGLVNPREVVTALCAACRNLGVRLVENCPVLQVLDRANEVEIITSQGRETFRAVLISAGAWSGLIGVGPKPIPASAPVKGHLVGYQQPAQICNTIIRHGHTYLMQRANGMLIIGASVEHVGFDRSIDSSIAADLVAAAGFVMPRLLETSPSETWVGFRPGSERLHLGRWQSGNIYLAYGHYRNGILLAPLTADQLAAEITANLAQKADAQKADGGS
jgi:glycine oxidase